MTIHKSAFYPIEISPELVKILESRPFGSWWHQGKSYSIGIGRSYLTQEVKDGKIDYREGYDASRSYYYLQKLIQTNPALRTQFDRIKGLRELGEQLVTIVDEQNHRIKVHGVDIKIDGNPTVEQMFAIGEGLRRHEPWLIKALFALPNREVETKLLFKPEEVIIPFLPEQFDFEWSFVNGLTVPIYEFNPGHLSISIYISSDKKSTANLLKLTGTVDHEIGHAVDDYLLGFALSLPEIPLPPPLTRHTLPLREKGITYLFEHGLCTPQLLEVYGRKTIEILNPKKLSDYEKAVKQYGLERNWNQCVYSPIHIIIESSTKEPQRHSDFEARELKSSSEFFAGAYSLFHRPDKRDNLQSEVPEWSAFFSLLEFADSRSPSIFDPANSALYRRNGHLINFCEEVSRSIKAKMSLAEEANSCNPN